MDASELAARYRDYIACLNRRDLAALGEFVDDDVIHNDRPLWLAGYRAMLAGNFRDIPDLGFAIERLVCEPPHVAARLRFDCRPAGTFLGLAVDGRHIVFTENVIYAFAEGKIARVWSVIDKSAIEAQLAGRISEV
jgi:predicted ester cyclase